MTPALASMSMWPAWIYHHFFSETGMSVFSPLKITPFICDNSSQSFWSFVMLWGHFLLPPSYPSCTAAFSTGSSNALFNFSWDFYHLSVSSRWLAMQCVCLHFQPVTGTAVLIGQSFPFRQVCDKNVVPKMADTWNVFPLYLKIYCSLRGGATSGFCSNMEVHVQGLEEVRTPLKNCCLFQYMQTNNLHFNGADR